MNEIPRSPCLAREDERRCSMTATGVRLPASEPGSSGRALAATAAFLLVAFITFGAALISAPTKGIRIFPLGPYINEAINSGR